MGPQTLTADVPLHLEDHLDTATLVGSDVPTDIPDSLAWRFDEPQPSWRPAVPPGGTAWAAVEPVRVDDALRLPLTAANRNPRGGRLAGSIYVTLPDLSLRDWAYVEIRARTSDPMFLLGMGFNHTEEDPISGGWFPYFSAGVSVPLVTDGTVQTYRLPLSDPRMRPLGGRWTDLGIWFNSDDTADEATLDILSVRLIPVAADYASARVGVAMHGRPSEPPVRDAPRRRSVYLHAPGRLTYRVEVPNDARLHLGLGVLREEPAVQFAVGIGAGERTETVLEETYASPDAWADRSIDLSRWAGQTVDLTLEATAEPAGTVALWGAPTLSGARTTQMPNVIFYVIDGAGADYMSLHGYNRRTTPNLERIAAEGAVFERAYSNTPRTISSTPSFLTSLQHAVLGGLRNGRNPVPDDVPTMAELLHGAGFQTARFTSNPNAGSLSRLDRGTDFFREARAQVDSSSSVELHENFWRWRGAYPGEPYWVHFQTTDVHMPHTPMAPFSGLYLTKQRREALMEWQSREGNGEGDRSGIWEGWFEETGVDRVAYASAFRDAYDEDMAHQDDQLGRLVKELKARGEWERTLLIVASDHGAAAGSQDWRILMRESAPTAVDFSDPGTPILRTGVSRIPLIFVWPGTIAAGQRFRDPVSMIDVLPTILDLVGLPPPELTQGHSLAPLLLGQPGWEPRPVILEEFTVDAETGALRGRIEVIDGRWGASLEINRDPSIRADVQRPVPLLLYDLLNDPDCLHSLHGERPDLVQKYTELLEARFAAHQALGQRFTPGAEVALTPDQLRALRTLGYIQ